MVGEKLVSEPATLVGPPPRGLFELEPSDDDLVDPGDRRRKAGEAGAGGVEVTADDRRALREDAREPLELEPRQGVLLGGMQVRDEDPGAVPEHGDSLTDAAIPGPFEPVDDGSARRPPRRAWVQADHLGRPGERQIRGEEERVRLPRQRRAEPAGVELRQALRQAAAEGRHDDRGDGAHAAPPLEMGERPHGYLLQRDHPRAVLGDEPQHALEVELAPLGHRSAVKDVPRADEQAHAAHYSRPVRIALVDPPGFTTPYDHALAAALARAGEDVELLTSRFRFGPAPDPDGYRRQELFYPFSSRIKGRSPVRLPLRVAEHLVGLARLRERNAHVLHHQWVAALEIDVHLLPLRAPAVMTAHDVLPRRTATRIDLWRRMYGRFDAVVVHSADGRHRLVEEVGVDPERIHVIPHPVFPGTPRDEDDGRTLLAMGTIRPYKQLEHSVEVAERVGARLLVAGDAVVDVSSWRDRPGIDWRLGYLGDGELDDVLAASTVAVFPYRREIDQSGALLRALGSGVPVVAYGVGGVGEPVRRFGAGAVVAADDVDALAEAAAHLLDDRDALAAARAGALRAGEELTWDAAAAAHLALYRQIAR